MAYPIGQLDDHPKPGERDGGRPLAAYGPQKAVEPEGYERDVGNDEAPLMIVGDKATHEASWGKDVIEVTDVLFH
jgi:hypothetical protein